MIGKTVEFPTGPGCYEIGIVTSFDESNGKISVRDNTGNIWYGYDYQVLLVD